MAATHTGLLPFNEATARQPWRLGEFTRLRTVLIGLQ